MLLDRIRAKLRALLSNVRTKFLSFFESLPYDYSLLLPLACDMIRKVPRKSCVLAALEYIFRYYDPGLVLPISDLFNKYCTERGCDPDKILKMGRLETDKWVIRWRYKVVNSYGAKRAIYDDRPVLAIIKTKEGINHAVVLIAYVGDDFLVADPTKYISVSGEAYVSKESIVRYYDIYHVVTMFKWFS